MKKISKFLCIFIAVFALSCENDEILAPDNYVTFEGTSASVSLDVDSAVSDQFRIFTGSKSGSDRTFNVLIDPSTTLPTSSISIPSSITVPGGTNEATVDYTITYNSDVSITGGIVRLRLEDTSSNILGNGVYTINVGITCESPVTIDFIFDGYGSDVSWTLSDSSGTVLYSGDGYSDGQAAFTRDVCLGSGDYVFTVNDSFGDGLSFLSDGVFTLTYNGVVIVQDGGNYGAQSVNPFSI